MASSSSTSASPHVEPATYKGFTFPPFYSLPPFFTEQPTPNTKITQLEMWRDLILGYTRFFNMFTLDIQEALASPLFKNDNINRSLSENFARKCLEYLVEEGKGEWDNKKTKKKLLIHWRTPEEWGEMMLKWATSLGKLNEVMTLYDLAQGEDSEKEEFHGLPNEVLERALGELQDKGKCVVFSGETSDAMGVKFFM
eukprot:CAMPEP_0201513860 /NCGR_PEP_ID=MMETSP0161_2-20130828/5831_1 /ASSEMBLY_ACC=CAM_ASM_000251 /TAXON_ID=180227 /ORGANISM="Neoparamoeba aestuarina, Strain SoJaBio B1-5/56/2" /LENGTH=196 /DNA_ID=CAMNT_0047910237 /DNA_START=67 /DNA_END=657 /DNA_ORIENTATION=+